MDDEELLEKAHKNFIKCQDFYEILYQQGQEDQEFLYGRGQWCDKDLKQRKEQQRPALVLNQMLPFAHQVINDIKQARPSIKISPADDGADVDTAEILQGLIRNIERQNKANDAYDMAVMNTVGAGYGWIRINTQYCNSMTFDQEPTIERVANFQSIFIDPASQALDGSDMNYAFVFDDIEKDDFTEEYPDAVVSGFDGGSNADEWESNDTIRVVEYFYKEIDRRTIYLVATEDGREAVITKEEYNELEKNGVVLEKLEEREAEFEIIKYCKLTGAEVLEKADWIGSFIPIVPVFGEECWLDGKLQSHSLIKQAKDAQRAYNYWKTCTTEMIALQPKAPTIGAVGSFASYPNKWSQANTENYSFLEYDILHDENGQRVEPPQRQLPAQGSPAMMQEAVSAREDIRLGLGIFESGLGEQGNEISGIAIENRQIKGENSTFHFMDNLASSISRVGVILVDLVPKLYSKRKVVRILNLDDTEKEIPVNQPFMTDKNTGEQRAIKQGEQAEGIYNLTVGKYDVVSDVGMSYNSKRQEMAAKLIEITQAAPELMGIVGDKIIGSLDIPEGKEIAERLRAQMPPELLGDDPQAAKMQQAAKTIEQLQEQINNLDAALKDKQKKEDLDREYKSAELTLDAKKAESEIAKTNADIAKIMSEIQGGNGDISQLTQQLLSVIENVDDLKGTVNIMLDDIEQDIIENEQAQGEPAISPKQQATETIANE